MRKERVLQRALPIVATSLGKKFGVTVKVEGNSAYTDGHSITIPASDPGDAEYETTAYGFLAHEAAHVRWSDFAVAQSSALGNPLRKSLTNIIEDARIERLMIEDFPGTRLTLDHLVKMLVDRGDFAPPTEDEHPGLVISAYVLYRLRADLVNQASIADVAGRSEDVVRKVFPRGVVTRLNALLAGAEGLTSSEDALSLADSILQMLKDEEEKQKQEPPPPPPQDQPQDSDDQQQDDQGGGSSGSGDPDQDDGAAGDPSKGDSPSNDQGSSDAPQGDAGTGDAGSNDQGKADGSSSDQGPTGPSGTDSGSDAGKDADAAKAAAVAKALAATAADVQGDFGQQLAKLLTRGADGAGPESRVPTMPRPERYIGDQKLGAELVDRARSTSGHVRALLQGLVQAHRLEQVSSRRSGRRIDGHKICRVSGGDSRIFIQRHRQEMPNTAIHLVIDRSLSMSNKDGGTLERLTVASEASIALALALEGIAGVSVGITAFPGNTGRTVLPVMPHGRRVAQNVSAFGILTSGFTPMAEALWFAASEVLQQPHERKVILVVTDGRPDNPEAVRTMIDRCEASGIETVGIGIRVPEIQSLFSPSAVIRDIGQLRSAMFGIAKDLLIGG